MLTTHSNVDVRQWATGKVLDSAYADSNDMRCAELLNEIENKITRDGANVLEIDNGEDGDNVQEV